MRFDFDRFRRASVTWFRVALGFLLAFSACYFVVVQSRALFLGVVEPVAAWLDLLLGLAVVAVLAAGFLAAHSRLGALVTVVGFAYWWMVPGNWVLAEWDDMKADFLGTFVTSWAAWALLGAVALLGLVNFFVETARLRNAGRSVFWGPWFSKFSDVKNARRVLSDPTKRKAVRLGVSVLAVAACIGVAGILPYAVPTSYPIPIAVRPRDYQVKFNFWATSNLSEYPQDVRAELNQHHVNMDVMFPRVTDGNVTPLVEWEQALPNTTYRVVLTPAELSELVPLVIKTSDVLVEAERNGTIKNWLGFCFDIEGHWFSYSSSFSSFEEAVGAWNVAFDYIERKSAERGRTIEMESVSIPLPVLDVPFDGDVDLQKEYRDPCYAPDRFTKYAPMVYRCGYEGEIPFGSPMDPSDPWSTSYEVYTTLYALSANLPPEKVGVYLGITNTSCYGRDLPQPERTSWGKSSGLWNLIRDVLIAKHFGVEEVTFFLPWTAIENNYSMGGTFESYGVDFLDVVNATVNGPDAPDEFFVYYNSWDAKGPERLRYDWYYDFSRPRGLAQFAGLLVVAALLGRVGPVPWSPREAQREAGEGAGEEAGKARGPAGNEARGSSGKAAT
ncbi:MAG: hypothetical protein Kow0069_35330 [Promethearchaeota archaeon]